MPKEILGRLSGDQVKEEKEVKVHSKAVETGMKAFHARDWGEVRRIALAQLLNGNFGEYLY